MKPSIKIDSRQISRALRLYEKATRKDVPRILNHAATQAAFKATSKRLIKDAANRWPLNANADPERSRRKWRYRDRFYYAMAQKNGTSGKSAARRLYRSRRSSRGYARANFGSIVNRLGVRRSRLNVTRPEITVDKARGSDRSVYISNNFIDGPGAAKTVAKMDRGWKQAISEATFGRNGIVEFALKRLRKHGRKYSATR